MSSEVSTSSGTTKKIAAAALAVALAAVLMIGGTFSYLMGSTDEVVNDFTGNSNSVNITEGTGDEYDIVPGTSDEKDPTVTASATVASYLYLVVYDNTDGLVDYEIDSSVWTLLYEVDDEGNYTGGTVYYTTVNAGTANKTYNVLKDQTVYYSAGITNEDLEDIESLTLSFEAYIIQQASFEVYKTDEDGNTTSTLDEKASAKDAFLYAYYNINSDVDEDDVVFVEDKEGLKDAIESDAYIILTDNVTYSDTLEIKSSSDNLISDVTIDLAGNDLNIKSIYVGGSGGYNSEGIVITSSQEGSVLTSTNETYAIEVSYGQIEEISNITIDASGSNYGVYVYGQASSIETIENVTIENATKYGIYLYKVNSDSYSDTAAIGTIADSTVSGSDTGLYIYSSFVDLVDDCTITGGNYGVYLRGQETNYTTSATITDSEITGTQKIGLVLNDWSGAHAAITADLTNCTLSGTTCAAQYCATGVIDLTMTDCTIGETTGSYRIETNGTGSGYINITADNLTDDNE